MKLHPIILLPSGDSPLVVSSRHSPGRWSTFVSVTFTALRPCAYEISTPSPPSSLQGCVLLDEGEPLSLREACSVVDQHAVGEEERSTRHAPAAAERPAVARLVLVISVVDRIGDLLLRDVVESARSPLADAIEDLRARLLGCRLVREQVQCDERLVDEVDLLLCVELVGPETEQRSEVVRLVVVGQREDVVREEHLVLVFELDLLEHAVQDRV